MKLRDVLFVIALVHCAFGKLACHQEKIRHLRNLSESELEDSHHGRHKRFLSFPNGAIVKPVLGFINILDFHPKHPTGNIVNVNNFQAQYVLPSDLITWFDKFGITRKLDARTARTLQAQNTGDESRKVVYSLVEEMLDNRGENGKECLLKSICEAAETPLSHNGLIGELLHIFFTPSPDEPIDDEYRDAMIAGQKGANCDKTFSKCRPGAGILDSMSILDNTLLNVFGSVNKLF